MLSDRTHLMTKQVTVMMCYLTCSMGLEITAIVLCVDVGSRLETVAVIAFMREETLNLHPIQSGHLATS